MVAGERLIRLARGATAQRAAVAYSRRERGSVLSDAERAAAEELEATLEAMFLTAAVDGQVASSEIAELTGTMHSILDAAGRERATADVDGLLVRFGTRLERDGWRARVDAVATRLTTPDARELAFRLAVAVAFVDEGVAHVEAAALRTLATALKLDLATAQHIASDVQEALFEG